MARTKRKTVAQLQKENDDLRVKLGILSSAKKYELLLSLGKPAIYWVGIGWVVYQIALAIRALAGLNTSADIDVDVNADLSGELSAEFAEDMAKFAEDSGINQLIFDILSNTSVSVYIAWGVAIGAFLFGLNERRARKDLVERNHPKQVDHELGIDKNRTSSGLTSRGQTSPGDEI